MRTDKVEINLYRIPLPTPIQAASTDVMTGFDLVMARVWDSDGASGCGYTLVHQGQGGSMYTCSPQRPMPPISKYTGLGWSGSWRRPSKYATATPSLPIALGMASTSIGTRW